MAKRVDKKAKRIKSLFDALNDAIRQRWETVNQKGHDFYLDNQLTQQEKEALEDQGMPTFTVNRIIPVVEMLNYYATSNSPRWQAVGVEQSDSDVASLFADVADYVWNYSNGQTLYSNVVNDSITKGIGFYKYALTQMQIMVWGKLLFSNQTHLMCLSILNLVIHYIEMQAILL